MKTELVEWAGDNPVVDEWMDSVESEGAELYCQRFKAFCEWIQKQNGFQGFGPEELLDFQDKATGRDRVKLINALNAFCKGLSLKYTPHTVSHYHSSTRSFFKYHGLDLPRRRFTLHEDHVEPEPHAMDRANTVEILKVGRPRDRAIYTICVMGGLGWGQFDQLNHSWDAIRPQLEEGRDIIRVDFKDRKQLKNAPKREGFFSCIYGDGLDLLKKYLKRRGYPGPGEPIFIRRHGGPGDNPDPAIKARTFRNNFKTMVERSGVDLDAGRYFMHQGRDVLRTEWQRSGADPEVAEFIMGHTVDQNKYLRFIQIPEYVYTQFKIVEPRLNLISNPDPSKVSRNEIKRDLEERDREIERLKTELERVVDDRKAVYENYDRRLREIEELLKKLRES